MNILIAFYPISDIFFSRLRLLLITQLLFEAPCLYLLAKRPYVISRVFATAPSDYEFDLARANRDCQMVIYRHAPPPAMPRPKCNLILETKLLFSLISGVKSKQHFSLIHYVFFRFIYILSENITRPKTTVCTFINPSVRGLSMRIK